MAEQSFDVIVVGAGIVGASVAHALSARGHKALLLEQGEAGGAVSGASLACIGTHMISGEELPLLKWACARWAELDEELGHPFEFVRCGQIRFLAQERDRLAAERWVEIERAAGLAPEILEPKAIREIEPRLEGPIVAGTWSPGDSVVNPFLAVRALIKDAQGRGLALRLHDPAIELVVRGSRIEGLRTATGVVSAPVVVLATGPWTARLAATAGLELPIRPRRAQCLASVTIAPAIRTVVGASESEGGVESGYTQIQQAKSGQILFNTVLAGGLSEEGAQDVVPEVDRQFVVDSIATLTWLFPSLSGIELLRSWVRYEAVTPDDCFLIGPAGPEGLIVAAGDGGTGFVRAPAIGTLVADVIAGHPSPWDRSIYDPCRFELRAAH